LGIQPEQQTNVFTNVLAALAADSAWSTRRISHNVAGVEHCTLETIHLGDCCHRTKAGYWPGESTRCLCGLECQLTIRLPRLFDLDHPFCQHMEHLLGINRLDQQLWGERIMQRVVLVASSILK